MTLALYLYYAKLSSMSNCQIGHIKDICKAEGANFEVHIREVEEVEL